MNQLTNPGPASETPRSDEATHAAGRLRTWIGRSLCLTKCMTEMEHELNELRAAVYVCHTQHAEGKCALCDVLRRQELADRLRHAFSPEGEK
jgi:hypothetical protein